MFSAEPHESEPGHAQSAAALPMARAAWKRIAIFYLATSILTIAGWYLIHAFAPSAESKSAAGAAAASAGARASSPAGTGAMNALPHVLLALGSIIIVSRILGFFFRKIGQPRVIGEITAGILLGPSFLGWISPAIAHELLPAPAVPYLNILAQVGIVLFMFLVGLELDPALLRSGASAALAISHASIVAPFLLGSASALLLYPSYAGPAATFDMFSMFLGVSMSVTAFPVLARILTDRGIHTTRLGTIALGCAAIDDITAWCLLAGLVSMAGAHGSVFVTLLSTAAYVLFMIFVARPIINKFAARQGDRELRQGMFAIALVAVLASALITEYIGIHALFGAFCLGFVTPHNSPFARQIRSRTEDLVLVLLLPAFFAFTGMRTQLALIHGSQWFVCLFIILIATIGKFGGSFIAGRAAGLGTRDSAAIGILMNTRGLMELIVLNVGYDLGILGPDLFAMLVVMAIVTTFATTPLLHLLMRNAPASGSDPMTQGVEN